MSLQAKLIKEKISNTKLGEAIDILVQNPSSKAAEQEAIQIKHRYNVLKKKERVYTISSDAATLERNQIIEAIFNLLKDDSSDTPPKKNTRKWLPIMIAVPILSFLIFFAIQFNWFAPKTSPQQSFQITRDYHEGLAAVFQDKWGFINQKGELVIPLVYDAVENFNNNMALVKKGEQSHYINPQGICVKNCEGTDAMQIEFNGNNNKAIDARGGSVIINE